MFDADAVDDFNALGYLVVKNAFSKEVAAACKEELWNHIRESNGVNRLDHSTWKDIVKVGKVWNASDGYPWSELFSDKLNAAIRTILSHPRGEVTGDTPLVSGKANNHCTIGEYGAGWWTLLMPGFAKEPWEVDGNWHIDGYHYRHYLFSKEVGLVAMMLFSDILPNGGGTAVAECSHIVASQVLLEAGLRGCTGKELSQAVMNHSGAVYNIVELTGECGDVILLHPFLLHARSKNLYGTPSCPGEDYEAGVRFLCHPAIPLQDHMDFSKPWAEMSILERSIVRAVLSDGETCDTGTNVDANAHASVRHGPECSDGDKAHKMKLLRSLTPEACAEFNSRKKSLSDSQLDTPKDSDNDTDGALDANNLVTVCSSSRDTSKSDVNVSNDDVRSRALEPASNSRQQPLHPHNASKISARKRDEDGRNNKDECEDEDEDEDAVARIMGFSDFKKRRRY
jgi:hypothetical protein